MIKNSSAEDYFFESLCKLQDEFHLENGDIQKTVHNGFRLPSIIFY